MKGKRFHKAFTLNGVSFSSEEDLLVFVQTISDSITVFLNDWFSEQSFIVVQTSGSTGVPKPIRLKKTFMRNSAKGTGDFFGLQENTTALLCMSTDYIAGKMMLIRALTLGWQLDVVTPKSNPLVGIDKEYDFSAMVPLQLQNSLPDIHCVKKLIDGGGAVSMELQKRIQHIETQIFATYGMTETITHIAVKKLNHFATILKDTKEKKIAGSFYKVVPNITIYKDERNCLLIKAPKVSDDFIITNDVVSLISDTEFEWLGRFDNVINSGGIKLHPEKIEEKLAVLIKERFFVAGIKDTFLGEKLVLIVEGEEKTYRFSSVGNIAKYEIPKEVYFVTKFIETETKKIQRSKTLNLLSLF